MDSIGDWLMMDWHHAPVYIWLVIVLLVIKS